MTADGCRAPATLYWMSLFWLLLFRRFWLQFPEFEATVFPDGNFFKRFVFSFEPCVFRGFRAVAVDKEQRRPEQHQTNAHGDTIAAGILVDACGELVNAPVDAFVFSADLITVVIFINERRD